MTDEAASKHWDRGFGEGRGRARLRPGGPFLQKMSPAGWAKRACDAFHEFKADRLVAERNFGGAMVEYTIKQADPNVPVHRSRGEQGQGAACGANLDHVPEGHRLDVAQDMLALEDQLCFPAGTLVETSAVLFR